MGFEDAQLAAYDTAIAICSTGVTVSPAEITLAPGETTRFSAAGRPGEAFDWSANAGTIDAAGTYTAPTAMGEYTVTATSRTDPSHQGTARIDVRSSLMAGWTSQQGGLSASASLSTPGGEMPSSRGTCENLLVPAQGSSFDGTRDCTGSGSWGTARSASPPASARTPAGNAFRVIEMHVNGTSTASWSSDGAVLHRFNSGTAPVPSPLISGSPDTPYRLTGSLDKSMSGLDGDVQAHYSIDGPDDVSHDAAIATGSFTDQGILHAGSYSVNLGAYANAKAGLAEDDSALQRAHPGRRS